MSSRVTAGLTRVLVVLSASLLLCQSPLAQDRAELEAAREQAFRKFHNGQVLEAAGDMRALIARAGDRPGTLVLYRDLADMCATALDWSCVEAVASQAMDRLGSDRQSDPLVAELFSYLVKVAVARRDDASIEDLLKAGGVASTVTPASNPAVAAEMHLALHAYFVRKNDHKAATDAYSAAVLSLLLMEPSDRYGIAKILVRMFEALMSVDDLPGAMLLVDSIDAFLQQVNRNGPLWAEYRMWCSYLLAAIGDHKAAVSSLQTATTLTARLDIADGARMHRLAGFNGLGVLTLVLEGRKDEAAELHARHPFQPQRRQIVERGAFQTSQELYFAVSDLLLAVARDQTIDRAWKPLLQQKFGAEVGIAEAATLEALRNFGLGIIATLEGDRTGDFLKVAARLRIDELDGALQRKSEGLPLPSTPDRIMLMFGMSAAAGSGNATDDLDLLLHGSEMQFRTLRHRLSDFAVRLGSQKDERARKNAHSYNLLVGQKREWELRQIRALLAGSRPLSRGELINTYTQLVETTARLREQVSGDADAMQSAGLPAVRVLQQALAPGEVFIAYFTQLLGHGRLCIGRDKVVRSVSPIDPNELRRDLRLLELALSADHAADEQLDVQFPVAAALNVRTAMFGGLDDCMVPGSHVIVASPQDTVSPGALLSEEPPRYGNGYDLKNARWLAKDFSFTVTLSARHFLATRRNALAPAAARPYLGVGDPDIPAGPVVLASNNGGEPRSSAGVDLSAFKPLPETAAEIAAAARQLKGGDRDVLLKASATEEAFRSRPLGTYDVIHFATHGLLKGDAPGVSEAALLLTPKEPTDSFNDGILSAPEISRLALRARLVVLSACNSARTETAVAAQGIGDLQAAFSVAGVPSLVATLWSVETETARELMTRFFDIWRTRSGSGAAQVLAIAVRDFLAQADRAHQHPRFWAPFVVFGYGGALNERVGAREAALDGEFDVLDDSRGDVLHAVSLGSSTVLAMSGAWNGERFASIVANTAGQGAHAWKVQSYDVGAAPIAAGRDGILVAGYGVGASTVPVARKIDRRGVVQWERRFTGLADRIFSAVATTKGRIVFAAESIRGSSKAGNDTILVQLNPDGSELRRATLPMPGSENVLAGRRMLLAGSTSELAVATLSQQRPGLGKPGSGTFGLPRWCPGAPTTVVSRLDPVSLKTVRTVDVPGFQAHSMKLKSGRIILTGQVREPCQRTSTAAVVTVEKGTAAITWRDDDPLPSVAADFEETRDGLQLLVRRTRPIGIRSTPLAVQPVVDNSKRWGDDNLSIHEISVINLDARGRVRSQSDSSFGLSAYAQGQVLINGRVSFYGSLGGRPALSRVVQ